MNAMNRKRPFSKAQREYIQKRTCQIYAEMNKDHDRQLIEQIRTIFMIALLKTMDEKFKFDEQHRDQLLDYLSKEIDNINQFLLENKWTDAEGNEEYDSDYSLKTLNNLADYYNIEFDRTLFNIDED